MVNSASTSTAPAMVADIRTLLLMMTAASLIAVAWRGQHDGLAFWAAALCINALA